MKITDEQAKDIVRKVRAKIRAKIEADEQQDWPPPSSDHDGELSTNR